jgi:O-acetylhomoserine/O-acetylserine sulfhydrylase-like pyridoxal-dependent enzyme
VDQKRIGVPLNRRVKIELAKTGIEDKEDILADFAQGLAKI